MNGYVLDSSLSVYQFISSSVYQFTSSSVDQLISLLIYQFIRKKRKEIVYAIINATTYIRVSPPLSPYKDVSNVTICMYHSLCTDIWVLLKVMGILCR